MPCSWRRTATRLTPARFVDRPAATNRRLPTLSRPTCSRWRSLSDQLRGGRGSPPFLVSGDYGADLLRFRRLDDIERCRLADPVLDVRQARRAGEADGLEQPGVQHLRVLRPQVRHRVDAQSTYQRQPAVHARDLEQRALVDELEKTARAEPGSLRQTLAVDVERCAMKELVRVPDARRAQSADVVVGDSGQVLERAIHPRLKDKARV